MDMVWKNTWMIVYYMVQQQTNLKRIFDLFLNDQDSNITLNPKKCKFGLSSIKYGGHIIDQNGIRFARDKIEKSWTVRHLGPYELHGAGELLW